MAAAAASAGIAARERQPATFQLPPSSTREEFGARVAAGGDHRDRRASSRARAAE